MDSELTDDEHEAEIERRLEARREIRRAAVARMRQMRSLLGRVEKAQRARFAREQAEARERARAASLARLRDAALPTWDWRRYNMHREFFAARAKLRNFAQIVRARRRELRIYQTRDQIAASRQRWRDARAKLRRLRARRLVDRVGKCRSCGSVGALTSHNWCAWCEDAPDVPAQPPPRPRRAARGSLRRALRDYHGRGWAVSDLF